MNTLRDGWNALRVGLNADRDGVHCFRRNEIPSAHGMNAFSRALDTNQPVGNSIAAGLNSIDRTHNALRAFPCCLHGGRMKHDACHSLPSLRDLSDPR